MILNLLVTEVSTGKQMLGTVKDGAITFMISFGARTRSDLESGKSVEVGGYKFSRIELTPGHPLKEFTLDEIREVADKPCALCDLATDVSFPPRSTCLAAVVGYSPDGSASVSAHGLCDRCAQGANVAIIGYVPDVSEVSD